MGSYNKYNWPEHTITLENFKAWLDSLDCPLISSTSIEHRVLYVNVDDAVTLFFALNYDQSSLWYDAGYQIQGNSTTTSVFNDYSGNTVVVCFSDDVLYLHYRNNYDNLRKSLFVYEKLGNKKYFMGIGSDIDGDNNYWYNIQGKTFTCLETDVEYTHESRLKYTQKLNYIDYTYDHLVLSGGEITNIEDDNFASCSTVELNRVVSFNDQNFYTIGTNILFPID